MDIEVWFSTQATDEAARMSRRWYYWPVFLLKNLYGLIVMIAILFGGCSLLVGSLRTSRPDLPRAALGMVLVAAPVVVFWWFRRRVLRTSSEMLAAINPLSLTFDAEGLHTREKNGARSFVPWSGYDGFREGRNVILLRDNRTKQYRIVPKNTVPVSDVEVVRSAIRSRLPEIR